MNAMSDFSSEAMRARIAQHLTYTLGKDKARASLYDWRMAVSHTVRDLIVEPWFAATRRTYEAQGKRVYYLSMEFLIGRILEDAMINLGLRQQIEAVLAEDGIALSDVIEDEPDAALGNGGLGRLAACFMESMSTIGCPAFGYGIRYEHGLFRQRFEGGRQVETPEDWLNQPHPWEFERPEAAYTIPFKGHVHDGVWTPAETVLARAYDTPVVGWKGEWANTLRLWGAHPTELFDLDRFNSGDHTAAAHPEALARTLSRVLYPEDATDGGKELRLKQEFFLVSAALQDLLRRFRREYDDLNLLPEKVAIQMNDTHPALAGPEMIRLLMSDHGVEWDAAKRIAQGCLNYTNHTLLPEALESWSTWLMGRVLPRHMQIIERIDAEHRAATDCAPELGIVHNDQVHMGTLAFVMASHVNGVSALHSDLMQNTVFAGLDAAYPNRILNQTNGVTPRRWMRLANPALSGLITDMIGAGWEDDLGRLSELAAFEDDAEVIARLRAAKRANKVALAEWVRERLGVTLDPDAMFDVQIKRIHEYKRQLLNIFETIARWQAIRQDPEADWTPRVKIFGGKAAPGYWVAKDIIRLINDVAAVVNNDPLMRDRLKVIYPANYNVSMAERLIPAADLSEQISTAGKEASGTGNMKFTMNGALTIGTLDGANVEIRERVGAENFFLFGMDADAVQARYLVADHGRKAILESPVLAEVLQIIADGRFSPEEPGRYHGIVDATWNHDPFLVASDFDAYLAAQAQVDAAFKDQDHWHRLALRNIAGAGHFSSDRTIRGYMDEVWGARSLL
ncbi:glycogen/starch/alpha-glucan phosphorylase [Gymnodinialimonas ceratoperidinii]|uniref:Alpha-1,4 glucan phosphorylase n=1 Tax=Gymnodinialimonas ceratoperidinii TaxID=2856823 RepID=A0A8F6TYC9_9RHOB|nr:glycogen/starch/alpha-glucan phosphorylase [Gymnodinialimonas ceratoperidinii]QXT40965.1 glycogen/starch/alpha-glucan phosphorylase [Gymnodinialimonas ceratoperidinii]